MTAVFGNATIAVANATDAAAVVWPAAAAAVVWAAAAVCNLAVFFRLTASQSRLIDFQCKERRHRNSRRKYEIYRRVFLSPQRRAGRRIHHE